MSFIMSLSGMRYLNTFFNGLIRRLIKYMSDEFPDDF